MTSINLAAISVKQLYYLLLDRGVTHTSEDSSVPPVKIMSKLELTYQDRDFTGTYRLSRLFGLSPEQKSFLFKLLQRLLPTRERLFRIGKVVSPDCVHCPGQVDDVEHLFSCPNFTHIMNPLSNCLTTTLGYLPPEDITSLNIYPTESMELPVVWLVATSLSLVWEAKSTGKQISFTSFQSEVLVRASFLKQTKWRHYTLHNSALLLHDMIVLHLK